ncbi:MAG: FlgD immunoglobulin-like domain containing protein [bacterium]
MRSLCSATVVLTTLVFCPIAAAQLPTVETGGAVSIYATFPTDPGVISFDATDNLFVGNLNNPGPPDVATVVWVVSPIDSSIDSCATVADPDAVYVDRNGLISSPGTLLVGGWIFGTMTGQVVGVPVGCGVPSQIASGGCLGNIHTIAEDSLGRLYVTNGSELTVCVWNGVSWSQFLPPAPGIPRIAIDGVDIYVSAGGIVRRYDTDGTLVDAAFTTGAVHSIGPSGSEFEGVIVERTDLLLAVDPVTKAETRILSGTGSTGIMVTFDSAGDLYMSQGGEFDRILHVTQSLPTGVGEAPIAGDGRSPLGETRGTPSLAADRDVVAYPNPGSGLIHIVYRVPDDRAIELAVFDVSGRRVRSVASGRFQVGVQTAEWDGRDESGVSVAAGTYFARLTGNGVANATERLTIVR